jgi:hypothetical protein
VVTRESTNAIQGKGLDEVNLLQAAEFAAAAMVIPGLGGEVTIGGKQVLQGRRGDRLTGGRGHPLSGRGQQTGHYVLPGGGASGQ